MESRCESEAIRRRGKIALAAAISVTLAGTLNAEPRHSTPSQSQSQPAKRPAVAAAPTDPARQIEAVRKAFDAGHTAEALRLANTFSAQHKDNAEFHTQLGVVLATNKQYKTAQLE